MNIRQFIRQAGYDIMEERITGGALIGWQHEFVLRFNLETRKLKIAEPIYDHSYRDHIDRVYTVYIDEAGFDGNGNLFVVLNFLDGKCFDVIEGRHMQTDCID